MNAAYNAKTDLDNKTRESQTAEAGTDDAAKRTAKIVQGEADERLKHLNDVAARIEIAGEVKGKQEQELRTALQDIYRYEADLREANKQGNKFLAETARISLEVAKGRWTRANDELQTIGTKDVVASLEVDGIKTMKTTVTGRLSSIESEIAELHAQLSTSGAGLANAPDVVTGVSKNNALILASDDASAQPGPASADLGEGSADVWTKVAFHVGSQSDSSSTKESHVSASANLSVSNWLAKVQASTSVSSSSKEVQSQMSSCSVDGSFSAMVVNIKRPWLHSDLFQDFDIDIAARTKLFPGAAQIKEWVANGDPGSGATKRTEYGKFPAYPTAFIVAADTVLEFKSSQGKSEEMMRSLSTDSSIQASYGPWGLKGGVSAKTNSFESA